MKASLRVAFVFFGALILGGCAMETITVKVRQLSKIDLAHYKTVGVIDFVSSNRGTREGAQALTGDVSTVLSDTASNSDFELIDRLAATARTEELERQTGDIFDRDTIVSLGRQAGARALIYGRVSSYEYSVEKKPWQDTQGKQHIEEIGRGHVSVFIQIAEVETGQVLDAFTYDKNVQASRGGLGLFGIITRDNIEKNTLLSTARKAIANDFIRRVVPYFENVPIRLYVNKDFPQLSQGNAKASLGNWNDAKDLYNASLGRMTGQLAENRYMALYNRAVAEKYLNEFDAAKKSFEEAYGLTRDANIKTQLEMVEERRKAYERLNKKAASASNPS